MPHALIFLSIEQSWSIYPGTDWKTNVRSHVFYPQANLWDSVLVAAFWRSRVVSLMCLRPFVHFKSYYFGHTFIYKEMCIRSNCFNCSFSTAKMYCFKLVSNWCTISTFYYTKSCSKILPYDTTFTTVKILLDNWPFLQLKVTNERKNLSRIGIAVETWAFV